MDFVLSEEQKVIRAMCRTFVDEVVAPRAEEVERGQVIIPMMS
ncbi:acyl-CoA dehydrogenase family protein [Chloroflexota bacterium]